MKNLRVTSVGVPAFAVLVFFATNSWAQQAQQRPPIFEKVAKTYGLDSWDKVDAIRYTWNIQFGTFNLSRSWEWEPKTTQVTYEGKDKDGKPVKVTYKRSELGSQPDSVKNEVDPGFINDNYTFLFPLKAYWDSFPLTHLPLPIAPFPPFASIYTSNVRICSEVAVGVVLRKPENRFLGTQAAAEYSGIPAGTLRAWRCQGIGPRFYKPRGRALYDIVDLDDFIRAGIRVGIAVGIPVARYAE